MSNIPLNFESDNVVLLNTTYHRGGKNPQGKNTEDVLSLTYRNLDTGVKDVKHIKSPPMTFFVAKDDAEIEGEVGFIKIEDTDEHTVPFKEVMSSLSKIGGKQMENYFWDCIRERNFQEAKKVHLWDRAFATDFDIEDWYKIEFSKKFGDIDYEPTRAFFDIEVDTIGINGFPEPAKAECPVNAVTYIDRDSSRSYTLLLRNPMNPLIAEFEADKANFEKFVKDFCYSYYDVEDKGNAKQFKKIIDKLSFDVIFYDDEMDLISDIMVINNTINPDFALAWNMSFDIPYLVNRVTNLGYRPETVFCDREFPYKECWYKIDTFNREVKKKSEKFQLSNQTCFMDQMINYAQIRKIQSEIESYSLQYVAEREIGVGKLDFSHITTEFGEFPYKDYRLFVLYNVIDVISQLLIESKTEDIDDLFESARTVRYEKAFKETIFLRNKAAISYWDQGYVMAPVRALYKNMTDETMQFEGGLVGDPNLNLPNGVAINGRQSKYIRANVVDYDYESMYPNITLRFNMSGDTQLARVIINESVTGRENVYDMYGLDLGGLMMDHLQSKDNIRFANEWLNLPNWSELYVEMEKELGIGIVAEDTSELIMWKKGV